MNIGAAIRARRKNAGISQEALADAAGLDRSHMGKIERGERNVTVLNMVRIADALGCQLSTLLLEADL
jgi:transcriptional regulator with XRE-family HTH domain